MFKDGYNKSLWLKTLAIALKVYNNAIKAYYRSDRFDSVSRVEETKP